MDLIFDPAIALFAGLDVVPQRRKKWKDSTDTTTTDRYERYLFPAFENCELRDLTRDRLQRFLDEKASAGLSKSTVSHLRWDLSAIFKMAGDDALVQGNAAGSLVTPRDAATAEKRTLTREQVQQALAVLDLRERVVFRLAVLVGLRPGEIFALRWGRVGVDMVEIVERVYLGRTGDPKTERGRRKAAMPPTLASELQQWQDVSLDTSADALVFPSECGTFMTRDNFLRRNFQDKLEGVGLGWVNFQVLRRTQASLGHKEGIDPKVAADQRGHAIGVAIDTYTKTDQESRLEAVTKLEVAIEQAAGPKVARNGSSGREPGY
jgi:integrase